MFLFCQLFQPRCSYKRGSNKKKRVYIVWTVISQLHSEHKVNANLQNTSTRTGKYQNHFFIVSVILPITIRGSIFKFQRCDKKLHVFTSHCYQEFRISFFPFSRSHTLSITLPNLSRVSGSREIIREKSTLREDPY